MINNICAANAVMDRVMEGGQVVGLGLGIVFAVLALLWGVLALFKVFFYDIPEKRKNAKAKKPEKPVQTQPDEQPAELAVHQSNDEIIAVITAAVMAYRQSEGENGGFRVVSFKRTGKHAWNSK